LIAGTLFLFCLKIISPHQISRATTRNTPPRLIHLWFLNRQIEAANCPYEGYGYWQKRRKILSEQFFLL